MKTNVLIWSINVGFLAFVILLSSLRAESQDILVSSDEVYVHQDSGLKFAPRVEGIPRKSIRANEPFEGATSIEYRSEKDVSISNSSFRSIYYLNIQIRFMPRRMGSSQALIAWERKCLDRFGMTVEPRPDLKRPVLEKRKQNIEVACFAYHRKLLNDDCLDKIFVFPVNSDFLLEFKFGFADVYERQCDPVINHFLSAFMEQIPDSN